MDLWSKTETSALISLYRKCPTLYDGSDPSFTNKQIRNEKFNYIFEQMQQHKSNLTVEKIRRKIRTLYGQVNREKALLSKLKKRGEIPQPRLWCYQELSFLFKVKRPAELHDQTHLEDTIQPKHSLQLEELDNEKGYPCQIKKGVQNSAHFEKLAIETLKIVKDLSNKEEKRQLSVREAFCNYLYVELKKIVIPEIFDDLKVEILQLVSKKLAEERTKLQDPYQQEQ